MNIKLGQINSIMSALNAVGNLDLPVKISYWFARTASQLESEIDTFEQQRIKLLKKYSEVDEKGELILDDQKQAKLKDQEAFRKEYDLLAQEEVEVKMDPISIDKLGDINIKPSVVAALLPLLKDSPQENDKKE